jgi:hypothetical protein
MPDLPGPADAGRGDRAASEASGPEHQHSYSVLASPAPRAPRPPAAEPLLLSPRLAVARCRRQPGDAERNTGLVGANAPARRRPRWRPGTCPSLGSVRPGMPGSLPPSGMSATVLIAMRFTRT